MSENKSNPNSAAENSESAELNRRTSGEYSETREDGVRSEKNEIISIGLPATNKNSENAANPYFGNEPPISHLHSMHNLQQRDSSVPNQEQNANKNTYAQSASTLSSATSTTATVGSTEIHTSFGRYHISDINIDNYRYNTMSPMNHSPGSNKPQSIGGASVLTRLPTQRYTSVQTVQGSTPTLNSLLQSHSAPPQQRFSNNYEQQSQTISQTIQPQHVQHPSPPSHQQYTAQPGSWVSTLSPFNPQPGSSQTYRSTYSEQNRQWSGASSPSSPGNAVNSHPPTSQYNAPAPNSPGHPPSPSPQPTQASPSLQQEFVNQNSNDSSSGGMSGIGSGTPGTPNSQAMRPTPSPTGSSGSRSLSPAVGQTISLSRSSNSQTQQNNLMLSVAQGYISSQSCVQPQQQHQLQTQICGSVAQSSTTGTSQLLSQKTSSPVSDRQQQPSPLSNNTVLSNYQTPLSHPQTYKTNLISGQGTSSTSQIMSSYSGSPLQQFSQSNFTPRLQYPNSYISPSSQQVSGSTNSTGSNQFCVRPILSHGLNQQSNFSPYQQNWIPPSSQSQSTSIAPQSKSTLTTPLHTAAGASSRPINYLKQHLQHKTNFVSGVSQTLPQSYGNGAGLNLLMGPPHLMSSTNMGPPNPGIVNTANLSVGFGTQVSAQSENVSVVTNYITLPQESSTFSHSVKTAVTTGLDDVPIDDSSQHGTVSNAPPVPADDSKIIASKPIKLRHPPSENFEINSTVNWTRTSASPIFSSHVSSQDSFRTLTKKSDSLCKLYDMDDSSERREWLDSLLSFMEDRRTPITACPTISKQPLDLYRLYIYVKERGGFVEVTKSKIWKDVAGLLGIGASSSAAYTLRKHYTKNLLAFECHFDRGDIDPLPIIQQVEAGSKKKSSKVLSVPSPGSSNSQDSFPATSSSNAPNEVFSGYSSAYSGNVQDYSTGGQISRPSSQGNAQTGNSGSYSGQSGYNQYIPSDQYPTSSNTTVSGPGQIASQNRPIFPSYGQDGELGPVTANTYGSYGNRSFNQGVSGGIQSPTLAGSSNTPSAGSTLVGESTATYPQATSQQHDYFRPSEPSPQPRRHPDFLKESQPYISFTQRPLNYGGWQGNIGQYRGQYASSSTTQVWCNAPRTTVPLQSTSQQQTSWDQHRYAQQPQSSYQSNPQSQHWPTIATTLNTCPPIRLPQQKTPSGGAVTPNTLSFGSPSSSGHVNNTLGGSANTQKTTINMPPPVSGLPLNQCSLITLGGIVCGNNSKSTLGIQQSAAVSTGGVSIPSVTGQVQKKEISFPFDCIESIAPVFYRRKRLGKFDVCPVDPWRIFMSIRSGLLAESTWALDLLNVLLFDDATVHYFGLGNLPGLLSLLLEHFQNNLTELFGENEIDCIRYIKSNMNHKYYLQNSEHLKTDGKGIDLDQAASEQKVILLSNTPNYTFITRKGITVRIQTSDWQIILSEHLKNWEIYVGSNDHRPKRNSANACEIENDIHNEIINVIKSQSADIHRTKFIGNKYYTAKKATYSNETFENILTFNDPAVTHEIQYDFLFKKKKRNFTVEEEDSGQFVVCSKKCKMSSSPEVTSNDKFEETNYSEIAKNHYLINSEIEVSLDSDCREIDMDIEPRFSCNGSKQFISTSSNLKPSTENLYKSTVDLSQKMFLKNPEIFLKRQNSRLFEDECYTQDESSLYVVTDSQDSLARRCLCLSNIFRNLTFVPGNETILAKSSTFLTLIGRLLLLNHVHLLRVSKTKNYNLGEDKKFIDSCTFFQGEKEWWWDYITSIRENILVAVANIAGHLELSRYEEIIARPVLDGLLHWAICPSALGQDPFPSCSQNSSLSPQRLALEALCKLCVTDANVDLVIATPPHSRLEKLCSVLTRYLCKNEDQVLRELSVNLLHYLAAADSAMARTVALQSPSISYMVAFIEQAEQTALGVANQHGINYLRENPDSMGTSLDMLRRAAGTLLHLSKHPDNRPLFMQQEPRLLGLVMSHILDQQVALIISRVLFQVSRGSLHLPSTENRFYHRQYIQQMREIPNADNSNYSTYEREMVSLENILGGISPATENTSFAATHQIPDASILNSGINITKLDLVNGETKRCKISCTCKSKGCVSRKYKKTELLKSSASSMLNDDSSIDNSNSSFLKPCSSPFFATFSIGSNNFNSRIGVDPLFSEVSSLLEKKCEIESIDSSNNGIKNKPSSKIEDSDENINKKYTLPDKNVI